MRAPGWILDRDLPVMQAITGSVNLNMNADAQARQRDGNAIRQIDADKFKVMMRTAQAFHDWRAIGFANHERRTATRAKARHDSNSGFTESIGGMRRVHDRGSGRTLGADLPNSNGIANGLNEASDNPNRFVRIPLLHRR